MKKILLFFIFLSVHQLYAQQGIQWQKAYGGGGADAFGEVKQTADGGYILIGSTMSVDGDITHNHGADDVWVTKLDASNSMSWQKTYGGSANDEGTSIEQTTDGGYILIGTTRSDDGDVSGNKGNGDIWLVKLDANGNISWQKTYGGSKAEVGMKVHQTIDGGYIMLGETASTDGDVTTTHGSVDIWVVKLDANGIIDWQKTYGGTDFDYAASIEETVDGGYIVGGYTISADGDITGHYGGNDEWVIKLDNNGNVNWQKNYGGSGSDILSMVRQTTDGGYISIGYTRSYDDEVAYNYGNADIWVVKMDPAGMITWAKSIGGDSTDLGCCIVETDTGKYIAAGYTASSNRDVWGLHGGFDYWLAAMNDNGSIAWTKAIGGAQNDELSGLIKTKDGGYVAGGTTTSTDGDADGCGLHGHTSYDIWLVKLNSTVAVNNTNNISDHISAYPTVTNGLINLILPQGYEHAGIRMTNMAGQTIPFEKNGTVLNCTIRLGEIPAGVYLLTITGTNSIHNYKVVYQP